MHLKQDSLPGKGKGQKKLCFELSVIVQLRMGRDHHSCEEIREVCGVLKGHPPKDQGLGSNFWKMTHSSY